MKDRGFITKGSREYFEEREKRMQAHMVIEYNPAFKTHGYTARFVENVSRGLRFVGYADDIARLGHKGWYCHDDEGASGEVYRGVVYRLPARDRREQYVYGYEDPCNDDCALVCFDNPTDDKEHAARQADRMAEIFAEHERDYDRVWQAGRRYEDLGDEIKDMRTEVLTLGKELREARRSHLNTPHLCAAIYEKMMGLYQQIQKLRKERDELKSTYGRLPGFEG